MAENSIIILTKNCCFIVIVNLFLFSLKRFGYQIHLEISLIKSIRLVFEEVY